MIKVLHIPKTGCTGIKHALNECNNQQLTVHPRRGHNTHIRDLNGEIAIIIRDPWQRFCSGFWERKTMPQREQISKSHDAEKFGYAPYKNNEKHILEQMHTPEEFFVWAQQNQSAYEATGILFEITDSICRWLGQPDVFYNHEHKISLAFDIAHLTSVMKQRFDVNMPTDPFRKRSRALFDIKQSYHISAENLELFKQWRSTDYEIIEHIISKEYFVDA